VRARASSHFGAAGSSSLAFFNEGRRGVVVSERARAASGLSRLAIAPGRVHARRLRCSMRRMWSPVERFEFVSHRSSGRRLVAWVWALSLVLFASTVWADEPHVEVRFSPQRPYVNDAINVTVAVSGAEDVAPPSFPELPHCTVQSAGTGTQITSETDSNGRMVMRRVQTFQYVVVPQQAGTLRIPPIEVTADGKTLRSAPQRIVVRDVPSSPAAGAGAGDGALLTAEITCRQKRLFVGQRGDFTLTISIKAAELNGRPLSASDMVRCLSGTFGPFDTQSAQTGRVPRRKPDGSIDLWYFVELPASFIVDQPGEVDFSGVTVVANYPTRFTRDFFGGVRPLRQKRIRIRPRVLVPVVQPLPVDGRPADFSGAVGHYSIDVIALPTNVRVGDPIDLTITITGDAVESLAPPDLTLVPGMTDDFRVARSDLAGRVSGNQKRFTETIRAKRADVKQIPPIGFTYFDPDDQRYVTVYSDAIPLLVTAVEKLDAGDLPALATQPAADRENQVETRDGLRGNKTEPEALLAVASPVTMVQIVVITVAGPVLFAGAWAGLLLIRKRGDETARRRRGALAAARRRIDAALADALPPGAFHSRIDAALTHYLADRFGEPPARFLGTEMIAFLESRGVEPELVRRCADLRQRCEQAAYGAAAEDDLSLADRARSLLDDLERRFP